MQDLGVSPRSDREVAKRASEDFAALFVRLHPAIVKFFARRTHDEAAAEELAQELFLRLLRHPELFTLDNVDGYVFRSAVNLVRDRARRDVSRGPVLHVDIEQLQLVSDAPDAEQALNSRQKLDALLRAIEHLPRRTRTVLILSRFENMSYAQISQRLGISVSAVEKQISKALRDLQAWR